MQRRRDWICTALWAWLLACVAIAGGCELYRESLTHQVVRWEAAANRARAAYAARARAQAERADSLQAQHPCGPESGTRPGPRGAICTDKHGRATGQRVAEVRP